MLADVSLLLHEIHHAVRSRRGAPGARAVKERSLTSPPTVFVTGLASSGKARLVAALEERLAPGRIAVYASRPEPEAGPRLHIHAETDIEALIEGGLKTASRQDAARADLIIPVDWESTDRSVNRVIEALVDRGLADVEAGV